MCCVQVDQLWSRALYLGEIGESGHLYYLYDRGYSIKSGRKLHRPMHLSIQAVECPCIRYFSFFTSPLLCNMITTRARLVGKARALTRCLVDATRDCSDFKSSRWHAQLLIASLPDFYRLFAIHGNCLILVIMFLTFFIFQDAKIYRYLRCQVKRNETGFTIGEISRHSLI